MAFHPKRTEPLEAAVRRVASAELERAEATLARARGRRRAEAIHDARKHLKKARALVKLVRFGIGEEAYRRENAWLRDAGRALAEVRDAHVLVATFSRVRREAKRRLGAKLVRTVRAALLAHRRAVEQRILERGEAIPRALEALRAARSRVEDWSIRGDGWDVLGAGLAKTYGDGRDAFVAAYDDPVDERFHEWRKRGKDLWHELQFLGPAWPAMLGALADEAHRLGDVLGDEHDLAVLRAVVASEIDAETAADLLAAIDERRGELQAEAHGIGSRLT
ncbi:MAG: CHAD domain-containing protein, partial [Candidatus Binatia bacterium]